MEENRSLNSQVISVVVGLLSLVLSLFFEETTKLALQITSGAALGWLPLEHVLQDLRKGKLSIDILMVLAAGGACILGEVSEGLLLLFLFSLGHLLETYAEWRTEQGLRAASERFPESALRKSQGGQLEKVSLSELELGDLILLRAGELVPVDGVVVEGESSLDESSVTGESIPVQKGAGSELKSGTLNQSGQLVFKVAKLAKDSTAQKIADLINAAREQHSREQALGEFVGQRYTWAVLIISLLAFALWFNQGIAVEETVYSTLALLVVASPCALVLSVPAAVLAAIARGASRGVLFRGGKALDALGRIRGLCFDKTGTLTTGALTLSEIKDSKGVVLQGERRKRILQIAASLEQGSTHPIANAFVELARKEDLPLLKLESFEVVSGFGLKGRLDAEEMLLGSRRYLNLPPGETAGLEVVLRYQGEDSFLIFEDTLRPESKRVIEELKENLIYPVILSGDTEGNVLKIATELGIEESHASLAPEDKLRHVERLKERFGSVGMVGDGMNDGPSLIGADVAVVLGGRGSGTALREADVVLINDGLSQLPEAINLSKRARRIVRQNLTISIGVALTLISFALFRQVPLSIGVLGHEGSTVLVLLNGLRLLRG